MQDLKARDIAGLRQALAAQAPGASLDDHRLWLARLDTMADAIVLFAAMLFALMISAMAMAVGFATRGAMAGNREIIEVLHFVGAADSYISRQFQNHFLRLGLKGGLLGGALAALFFIAAAGLSAWWSGSGRRRGDRRPVRRLRAGDERLCGDSRGRPRDRHPHRRDFARHRLPSPAPPPMIRTRRRRRGLFSRSRA